MTGNRVEFDETQTEAYENAARELADFVDKTGRSVRVLGVSPPERKLIHTELNECSGVGNTSEGFGLFRYVRLDLKREETAEPEQLAEEDGQD